MCVYVTYIAACLWPVCTANITVPRDKSSHRESLSIVACIPMYIVQNKQGCIISLQLAELITSHRTVQTGISIANYDRSGGRSNSVVTYLERLRKFCDVVNHGTANHHLIKRTPKLEMKILCIRDVWILSMFKKSTHHIRSSWSWSSWSSWSRWSSWLRVVRIHSVVQKKEIVEYQSTDIKNRIIL